MIPGIQLLSQPMIGAEDCSDAGQKESWILKISLRTADAQASHRQTPVACIVQVQREQSSSNVLDRSKVQSCEDDASPVPGFSGYLGAASPPTLIVSWLDAICTGGHTHLTALGAQTG